MTAPFQTLFLPLKRPWKRSYWGDNRTRTKVRLISSCRGNQPNIVIVCPNARPSVWRGFYEEKMWKNTAFIVTTIYSMWVLRWFLLCQIDPIHQFQSLIAASDATLHSLLFHPNSWIAVVFSQGKPDFGIRSECMNAETLCTTYYLVLLFYVDTCFKMWCISLYLPVLNTLCSSSS